MIDVEYANCWSLINIVTLSHTNSSLYKYYLCVWLHVILCYWRPLLMEIYLYTCTCRTIKLWLFRLTVCLFCLQILVQTLGKKEGELENFQELLKKAQKSLALCEMDVEVRWLLFTFQASFLHPPPAQTKLKILGCIKESFCLSICPYVS